MKKFEYKIDASVSERAVDGRHEMEKYLNELGAQGWELVAVARCGQDNLYLGHWFKRELSA